MSGVTTPTVQKPPIPGHYETVRRALPRYYFPSEPVILIEGAARSFKHGSDDRFSQDNTLTCRLTGFVVTELSCNADHRSAEPPVDSGTGCAGPWHRERQRSSRVRGLAARDRAARSGIGGGAGTGLATVANSGCWLTSQVARNFTVEQTVWWATRDPNFDHAPLTAMSGIAGTLPAAIAVSPPVKPWNPLHLDWKLEYIPSTNSVKDWTLGEIDYAS